MQHTNTSSTLVRDVVIVQTQHGECFTIPLSVEHATALSYCAMSILSHYSPTLTDVLDNLDAVLDPQTRRGATFADFSGRTLNTMLTQARQHRTTLIGGETYLRLECIQLNGKMGGRHARVLTLGLSAEQNAEQYRRHLRRSLAADTAPEVVEQYFVEYLLESQDGEAFLLHRPTYNLGDTRSGRLTPDGQLHLNGNVSTLTFPHPEHGYHLMATLREHADETVRGWFETPEQAVEAPYVTQLTLPDGTVMPVVDLHTALAAVRTLLRVIDRQCEYIASPLLDVVHVLLRDHGLDPYHTRTLRMPPVNQESTPTWVTNNVPCILAQPEKTPIRRRYHVETTGECFDLDVSVPGVHGLARLAQAALLEHANTYPETVSLLNAVMTQMTEWGNTAPFAVKLIDTPPREWNLAHDTDWSLACRLAPVTHASNTYRLFILNRSAQQNLAQYRHHLPASASTPGDDDNLAKSLVTWMVTHRNQHTGRAWNFVPNTFTLGDPRWVRLERNYRGLFDIHTQTQQAFPHPQYGWDIIAVMRALFNDRFGTALEESPVAVADPKARCVTVEDAWCTHTWDLTNVDQAVNFAAHAFSTDQYQRAFPTERADSDLFTAAVYTLLHRFN